MTPRRLALALLVVVAAGAGVLLVRSRSVPPKAVEFTPIVWTVDPPEDRPTGDPFRVARAPAPSPVYWKGTFAFEQRATGGFGGERTIPSRWRLGTFSATETTDAARSPVTTVEASFDLSQSTDGSEATTRVVAVKLSFERGTNGLVGHRTIRLDGPQDMVGDLEVFQFAWTLQFAPPDRAVRVGQRLPIDDCVGLEYPFQRPLMFLFQKYAVAKGPASAPIEGGVWIESRDPGNDGGVRLRAGLTHVFSAVNGPDEPDAVTIDYRAVMTGDRTVGLADSAVRRHAMSIARHTRFRAHGFDYAVVVHGDISMEIDAGAH